MWTELLPDLRERLQIGCALLLKRLGSESFLVDFRRQNAYIATQGPTRETMSDFWRMVWEQRSAVIVMMTKCEERGKVRTIVWCRALLTPYDSGSQPFLAIGTL